jgi:hypothetical protein
MYHRQFDQLWFPKKGAEVRQQIQDKIAKLDKRLEEREEFLRGLVAEAGVEDSVDALINLDSLLQTARRSAKAPAEAKTRMQEVIEKIGKERKEKELLMLVDRNLPNDETFNLEFEALRYFEF